MCSICKKVLPDFMVEHTEFYCPLRNSQYCSHCAKYGHLTSDCPAKPSRIYTHPIYVEQFIPPSELAEFKITSKTLLEYKEPEKPQQLLEIKDDVQVISAYLSARSIKVPKKITKKQALEEYAMLSNKRVVYIK